MNFKNLLKFSAIVFVFTMVLSSMTFAQVYVDATNGSDFYTGANETNNPAGTGPKATFAAARALVTNGGTIVIKAGNYGEAFDVSTGLIAATNSYTIQLKTLNVNTDINFTGAFTINKAGLTVNITQFAGTERIVQATSTFNFTAGSVNLAAAAAWSAGATATFNFTGASGLTGAAPTITGVAAGTGIVLNYTGGSSFTAGPESGYASYGGTGAINITKTAGTAVTFPNNIAFNAANTGDVINVTTGGANFSGTVNLGLGDIVNAGADNVNVTGLVSAGLTAGAGVVDVDLSSIILTGPSTGNITLSGGITWTGPNGVAGKTYGVLYAVDNLGSGTLSTGPVSLVANNTAASGNYTFGFDNGGTGTLNVGVVTAASSGTNGFYGVLNLVNVATGTTTVAGGSYRGTWTNAGGITVSGATTLLGVLTNNTATTSIIGLGANTLTLGGSNPNLTNNGTITASAGGGLLVNSGGASSFDGGTLSNVTVDVAGTAVTFQTNAVIVSDLTINNGTATAAINVTAGGTTSVAGGTLVVNNTRTLTTQDFLESSGIVTLGGGASGVIDVKGNFSRTGGTFTAGAGSLLSFTGTVAQTVDGGPLFQVVNVTFTNSVSAITVNNTIRATGTATISTATTVNFGTVNLVLNAAAAKMINNGIYNTTTGSGGGVILGGGNLVPLGVAVGGETIEGTGIYSYITVDVGQGNAAQVVNTLTGVKFNGVLRLYSGTLDVATAGVDFSPFGTSASIVVHLFNAGAQCAITTSAGTWNAAGVSYDLEYTNSYNSNPMTVYVNVTGVANNEFPVANRVKNLTISAISTSPAGPQITANRTILGNLTVIAGAELDLNGAALTANKTGAAHSVSGSVTQATPAVGEKLVFSGNGTLAGGSGASSIAAIDFNTTGTYSVTAMKVLGLNAATNSVSVLGGGIVNLGMANLGTAAAPNWGDVTNLNVTNGRVNLTTDIDVVNRDMNVGASGTFDFADQNVWWKSAGNFLSNGSATFLATGATTGGFLQFRATSGINTGGALVPRIIIDPAAAGTFTVTLGGNTGVSDILTSGDDDILALGANTFTHAGNTWNHGGTQTYTGTGVFNVTGNVTANLGSNATVPNLTVNNGTNTFTLVDNDGAAGTVPSLTVGTLFTFTAGNVNMNACDIILTDATGANVFTYTAGTFIATTTTGITATDNQNGELIFNGGAAAQSIRLNAACTIPNVTVAGTIGQNLNFALANAINLTVANRFVFGTGHTVNLNAAAGSGNLAFGDGCWVERRAANPTHNGAGVAYTINSALIAQNPVFPTGVIDLFYNINTTTTVALAAGTQASLVYTVSREMPASGTVLRNLYISLSHVHNNGGVLTAQVPVLNGSKDVLANALLYLINGNYDPEPGATTYALAMGANSTVNVQDGALLANAAGTFGLTGGPVTLIYSNTVARTTTSREYPSTAGFVSTLDVQSTAAGQALILHADRSCGDLVLNTGGAGVNTVQFDLNGKTLSVTNVASATLTKGVLTSQAAAGAVWTYGNLAVTGALTSTANASIQNVNVTAGTMTLAGPFGQTDWDGFGGNALVGVTTATVSGPSAIAAFNGNLTSTGNVTINGAHSGGTITASADVTVGTGGSMAAVSSNLAFIGTADATLTVPATGVTIGALTLNKTNNNNTVTLAGGNLATRANTTFVNGLFITGANTLNLFVPPFGAGQGFTRAGVTGTNISHVVGNVAKTLFNAGTGIPNGACEPRQEFPIGNMTAYKPVAVTFNPAFGLPTVPNATFVINYTDANPNGAVGLPIADGVATGIDVARYPNFYWTITSNPSIGPTTPFDLELTATGFTNFDDINNVRIIRRYGVATDVTNQWLLQGTNSSYDNSVNAGVPTIIQRQANAGLRTGGALFTLGLKSNMKVNPASGLVKYLATYKKLWLVFSDGAKSYNIADLFTGNIGSLTYVAQSSNISVATATVAGSTLLLTPVSIGDVVVTVIAQDLTYNDFFAYSFDVNVNPTDVESKDQLPTEFALFQNYPNPFNPTTNIKFDLPKESNVTLKVYNILGEEVATLVNKVMPAGHQVVTFDASRLASGMYIYRIQAGNFVQVKKMLLMK